MINYVLHCLALEAILLNQMMKLTLITLLLLLTAAWNLYITTPSPTTSPTTEPTIVPTPTVADKPKPVNQYIKIGAFNIQSFGKYANCRFCSYVFLAIPILTHIFIAQFFCP